MHEGTVMERLERLERELAGRIADVERRVAALNGRDALAGDRADRLEATLLARLDRLERLLEARLGRAADGLDRLASPPSDAPLRDRLEAIAAESARAQQLLEQQLIHARRVEAELVGLKRRVQQGSGGRAPRRPRPVLVRGPRLPALPTPDSATGRKLRKLLRDPEAFFADARSPALRAIGAGLFKGE